MLNILVCVKQVPDVNLVKIDPVTGSLIRKGVPAILNPLDSNALEAAVQVRERYGGSVTCITMGPDQAIEALRECLAAGADRAVLLSAHSAPFTKAMQQAGHEITLEIVPDRGHCDLTPDAWARYNQYILDSFAEK